MWTVKLALRHPHTVAVMALLLLVGGALSLSRMVVDIFPAIRLPVVVVIWNYPGLSALDMERRIVSVSERAYSTNVTGIARLESESIPGVGIVRIFFQAEAEMSGAIAQIAAASGTVLRVAPPGTTPPNIVPFDASKVPIAQVTMTSDGMPEEKIFDYALNVVRMRLFTIPGLATPQPFGGRNREISILLKPDALAARGLSPSDVVSALAASNVIVPAGTARLGGRQYTISLNASPSVVEQFRAIPIRVIDGAAVLMGDVATIGDAFSDQTNIARINGRRATYLAILKGPEASTLAVIEATRETLAQLKAVVPEGLDLKIDLDQSAFVRSAIASVVREGILAALLVSLLIGVFLGSWRSMLVVCTSIPLAILAAILGLHAMGHTINVMTLGGMALAIGILVDDATVEVENIHRNQALGKPLTAAILDGAREVAVPTLVSTLAICIVFAPIALLTGPARFLFAPMALAVVFAMAASYLLSRTLVPALMRAIMAGERWPAGRRTWSEGAFARCQALYGRTLARALARRRFVLVVAALLLASGVAVGSTLGTDLFPAVDAGMMKLHVRAPAGTTVEGTERLVTRVEDHIRSLVPPAELETINALIGVPFYMNLAFVRTDNANPHDAEILVSLRPGHAPTRQYMKRIRADLARLFPDSTFYFQPADIVSQILNFGQSAAISVQVEFPDLDRAHDLGRQLLGRISALPGVVDAHLRQELDLPELRLDVDRELAFRVGLSQDQVASNLLITLSSSSMVSPSYFLNPANNINYWVTVRTPSPRVTSLGDLLATPLPSTRAMEGTAIDPSWGGELAPLTVGNIATVEPRTAASRFTHHSAQRVVEVAAGVQERPLGDVVGDIEDVVSGLGQLPAGMRVRIRGQNEVMSESFRGLGLGLLLAMLLVYLLLVALFQGWVIPLVIMVAVPGSLVGSVWMLALTGSTINVSSLMGSTMVVGIAVSNSVLVVNFANRLVQSGDTPPAAAMLEACLARLRPVLITALAMVGGMLPMAFGLGEAGEQNAPLGRAVIGGVVTATVATLLLVPVVHSLTRQSDRPAGDNLGTEGGAT